MKIGKLKKVELRKLWKGEASDFTPWLAKEENIEALSEVIGIELEVISEEKSVGPFRADILCKSTIDDTDLFVLETTAAHGILVVVKVICFSRWLLSLFDDSSHKNTTVSFRRQQS